MFRTYKPKTPGLRHKRSLTPSSGLFAEARKIFFIKKSLSLTLSKKKKNSGLRVFERRYALRNFMLRPTSVPFIAKFIMFYKFPLRELVFCSSIFGTTAVYPSTDLTFPGVMFSRHATLLKFRANQLSQLKDIPLNISISFLYNKQNFKPTYARSSGRSCYKSRVEKKTKLICVILPSTASSFLPSTTWCLFTTGTNLHTNTLVGGKWGWHKTWKKTLHVRGVAKNPVDHPNGGRTKAKQPELSPWGWIAKNKK